MKSIRLRGIWMMFVISFIGLISCSEDDGTTVDLQSKDQIESNMNSGNWIITKFIDSGKDELNHFTGYTFIFDQNGILTSTNGSTTYEGSWSITDSNSNDDNPDDFDFNIHFNLTNEFENLNDDWDILSITTTKIELIDVSGGNGGTDYLTFTMN